MCGQFEIMSTVLLVGTSTGGVYAVDLRQNYIEERKFMNGINISYCRQIIKIFFFIELRKNEICINESRPSKLFIIRKNEGIQELKEMSDSSDCHLAIFINGKY